MPVRQFLAVPMLAVPILAVPSAIWLLVCVFIGLAACVAIPEPAVAPTPVPTVYPATPTAPPATRAPATVSVPTASAVAPVGPPLGPARGPAATNTSIVTASILAITADPQDPQLVRIRATVVTSAPDDGTLDFAAGIVGKEIQLVAQAAETAGLGAGDRLRATVVFVGDERGGLYLASQVQKVGAP
jgi:hypothetical protein